MEIKYSEEIASAVGNFLDSDGLNYTFDEEEGSFVFDLTVKGMIKSLHYIVIIKPDTYVVYALSPIGADKGDKKTVAKLAEFVCRANDGILIGNFELSVDSGRVAYKICVDCIDDTPARGVIRRSICLPALMFDRYGPGILAMLFSEISPAEAVELCEKAER